MQNSSPKKDRTVLSRPVTNEQIGHEFSAEIIDLSAKHAARIAHRTPAAAKKWKLKANAPDAASLINSAARHAGIRRWLLSHIIDPRALSEMYAILLRASDAGDFAARQLLHEFFEAPASTGMGAIPPCSSLTGGVNGVAGPFAGGSQP